jgi:hypothetical protein
MGCDDKGRHRFGDPYSATVCSRLRARGVRHLDTHLTRLWSSTGRTRARAGFGASTRRRACRSTRPCRGPRHTSAKSASAAGSPGSSPTVCQTAIVSYMRRPYRWVPTGCSRSLTNECTSASGSATPLSSANSARSVVEERHGPEPLPRGLGPKPSRTVLIAHELGRVGQCLESVRCPHQFSQGPLSALVIHPGPS